MSKLKDFSRRRFLRGAGKLILPLPFLECFMNGNGTAWANGLPFKPVYLFALNGLSSGVGSRKSAIMKSDSSGYEQNEWNFYFPDKFGSNYTPTIPLQPLQEVKSDVNLFTNLWIGRKGTDSTQGAIGNIARNFASHHTVALHSILSGNGDYSGRTENYTGSDGKSATRFTGYRRPSGTNTSDQVIYEKLGKSGKLLHFHAEKVKHGSGHHNSISWKDSRDELPERDLTRAFNSIFSNLGTNVNQAAQQKKVLEQKSVIDLMLEDYNSIKRTISSADRITVETHFEKIQQLKRDVDSQTEIDNAICSIPSAPQITYPTNKTNYGNEQGRAKILNNIIAMAAACGVSNVMTYGITHSRSGLYIEHFDDWVSNPKYQHTQERRDAHGNTHSSVLGVNGNVHAFKQFHAWQTSVYVDLIKKFKAVKIGNDSMLDYSNLVYMVEAGHGSDFEQDNNNTTSISPHSTHNMVAFNAGGKKLGMKLGQHIDGKKRHPLAIVNTAMKAMSLSSPQVGEVTSIIPEILT